MPDLTANYSSSVSGSLREDFSDIITILDPTETPVRANIGQIDIDNPEGFDWQLDGLNTPSADGLPDGFSFDDASLREGVTTRSRLKARCQIQGFGIQISNRLEQTDKAGLDSEISYQLALRADDLKRDCEQAITTNRSAVASASGTPPTAPLTAGIPSWLTTNVDYSGETAPTLGADGEPDGPGGTASPRAADESAILDLLGGAYDEGGNIDLMVVGREVKQIMSSYFFSSSARIATQYQDHGRAPSSGLQVVGAVDYYVSDFGVIAIVPDRFMNRTTDILMLDTSLFELGVFRGYEVQEMGKEGDNERFIVLHDFALISRDEAGSAIFANVDTTTAMVA